MKVTELIKEVKNLSKDEIIKFKGEFDKVYKKYADDIAKDQENDLFNLLDQLCDYLHQDGILIGNYYKCEDAPYEAKTHDFEYIQDDILFYNKKLPKNIANIAKKVSDLLDVLELGVSDDESSDLYPGEWYNRIYWKETHDFEDFENDDTPDLSSED